MYYTMSKLVTEEPKKWETIKILTAQKEQIEKVIAETGLFSSVPDFTAKAINDLLEKYKGGKK